MSDLISRQAALDCFHDWIDRRGDVHTADEMPEYQAIEDLPSAQPEPQPERKTGMWIKDGVWTDMYTADEIPVFKCSVCGDEVMGASGFDFCPNCGAKMEVEHEV